MKTFQMVLLTSLSVALLLTGCTNKTVVTASQIEQDQQIATNETNQKLEIGLYGKVKKIVGNSVTIALAEPPKISERTGQARNGTGNASDSMPPPPSGDGPPPNFGQGGPPTDGAGGGNRSGTRSGTRGTGFGLSASDLKLTGDVKEVMIPVGVTIQSAGGRNAKTIDFADIKVGDVITIFNVQGTEQIQRVIVSASSAN